MGTVHKGTAITRQGMGGRVKNWGGMNLKEQVVELKARLQEKEDTIV